MERCFYFLSPVKCYDEFFSGSKNWHYTYTTLGNLDGKPSFLDIRLLFLGYSKSEFTEYLRDMLLQEKQYNKYLNNELMLSNIILLTDKRIFLSLEQITC